MKAWLKNFSFLLLGVICSGFSRNEQDEVVHQVINFYCDKWEKAGFNCFGSGGRQMYEIQTIYLAFTKQGSNLSIQERREIVLEMVDDLTRQINSCRTLRPYLAEYPFGVKNCTVSIRFEKEPPFLNDFWEVRCAYGLLTYYFGVSEKELEESYEEAKEIISVKKQALMGSVKDDI